MKYCPQSIDQSYEQQDLSNRPRLSIENNQKLFTGKKERMQAMKVVPYPSPHSSNQIMTAISPRPFRVFLGNFMFSRVIQYLTLLSILCFSALIYLNLAFDEDVKDSQSVIDVLNLALLLLFLLYELGKFFVIGKVRYIQGRLKDTKAVADGFLLAATAVAISIALAANDRHWDWSGFASISRVLRLTVAFRKINEFRLFNDSTKKKGRPLGFAVYLASDKVREVLSDLLTQPWLHNNFDLYRDVQWCLDIITSNGLNQAFVSVQNQALGHKEEELIKIVNEYSKARRRDSAKHLGRKSTISNMSVSKYLSPVDTEMTEEVRECLRNVASCQFDVFKLRTVTKNNELFTLMHLFFKKRDLLGELKIDVERFANYVSRIQNGYNRSVIYHNATHAADVTQTFHYFLETCDASEALSLSPLDTAACYLAAAVHDFEHPGLSNAHLINTQAELAIRYNDKSVLENHHISSSFALAMNEQYDIYSEFQSEDFARLRTLMISMVLATDIVNHFSMISQFKIKFQGLVSSSDDDKDLCLEVLLHAADISNPTKPWDLCRKWADLVLSEFWEQGDKERVLGLSLGYLTDRFTANVPKSQIGFIDVIVSPTYDALKIVFPALEENSENLGKNKAKWSELEHATNDPNTRSASAALS